MATRKKKITTAEEKPNAKPSGPFLIRSIYIKKCEMEMTDEFDPLIPNQKLFAFNKILAGNALIRETHIDSGDGEVKSFKSASFVISFSFGYTTQEGIPEEPFDLKKDFAAHIYAEVVADYVLNGDEEPTQEMLAQWGSGNAVLHCWPYWREFCGNAQMRMNLPVTLLPLLSL